MGQHRSKPTLEDVARVAGVSRSTASRAVTDSAYVSQQVRDRVRRAVEELGYRPDTAARALAGRRDDAVAVVFVANEQSFAEDPYYGQFMTGVAQATAEADVRLSVRVTSLSKLPKVPELADSARYAGTVLVGVPKNVADQLDVPDRVHTVAAGASNRITSVDVDSVAGAREAVRHLLGQGRTRIAMINGPRTNAGAVGRAAGYRAAIREAGGLPIIVDTDFAPGSAVAAVRQLLDTGVELDALFVASDFMAAAVIQELAARKIRVPDDIAVAGFDDCVVARYTTPALTTMTHPVERIAKWAVKTSMAGNGHGTRTVFPTELVVRASTA